eukprot:TRINITY_DN49295_c0_g1_i1.p1 TRINITY_DN49295_c0_g1~~TRINITY_DN49295_c0_g1_i1.p1  ORF type:complete len:522 (-),score=72.74 TRINITY_DN49295_c0_g1_i1:34-1575(-)
MEPSVGGNADASCTACNVPSFAGRWRVEETGQEVVLCHNIGKNIIWSSPQPGREDVAGYCTVGGGRYTTILATWGGVQQRLGVVKKSEGSMKIHWFLDITKPILESGTGSDPDLLAGLHIRLASSVSGPKSVWQFVAQENFQWSFAAIVHSAYMHLQVVRLRRPQCARAIDGVTDVMCATVLTAIVWFSALGVQEAVEAATSRFLPQSADQEAVQMVRWHIRLNIELLLFMCAVFLRPIHISMSPFILVLISQLAGSVIGRVTKPPGHAELSVRVVYAMVLGLTVILRLLVQQHNTSRGDPSSWPGVRILDEEQREVVIAAFLEDCHNVLEVEEVFAVENREGSIQGSAHSHPPMTQTRRLYQRASDSGLKATMREGTVTPFRLNCFSQSPRITSFLNRALLEKQKPMFGTGLYFAANPHATTDCSGLSAGCQLVLACDVQLGRTRELRSPAPHLTPELMRRRAADGFVYGSVAGLVGPGHVMQEFAIYDASKATPKYIFCVRNKESNAAEPV